MREGQVATRGAGAPSTAAELLTAAAALRWARPDLTAAIAEHVGATWADDAHVWVEATGWVVHGGAALGDGREHAVNALSAVVRRGPQLLEHAAAHRLRIEVAALAAGHGAPEMARLLVDPLREHHAAEVRADALTVLARCAVEEDPSTVDGAVRQAEAAWGAVGGRGADVATMGLALLSAAALRRSGRPEQAVARTIDVVARLDRMAPGEAGTPPRHLSAALIAEWVTASVDAGEALDARARCVPVARDLCVGRPTRQSALLRLTMAEVLPDAAFAEAFVAMEQAASDAADCDSPDLESRCLFTLATLHERSGRSAAAADALRRGVAARQRNRARAERFQAALRALAQAPRVARAVWSAGTGPGHPTVLEATAAGALDLDPVRWARTEARGAEPCAAGRGAGAPPRQAEDPQVRNGDVGGAMADGSAEAGDVDRRLAAVLAQSDRAAHRPSPADGDSSDSSDSSDQVPSVPVPDSATRSFPSPDGIDPLLALAGHAGGGAVPGRWTDGRTADDGAAAQLRVEPDLVDDVELAAPPAWLVIVDVTPGGWRPADDHELLRRVELRLTDLVPPRARVWIVPDGSALTIAQPGWDRSDAADWMYRALPGAFAALAADRSAARTVHVRAIVHGVDGPVGARLLHRIDGPVQAAVERPAPQAPWPTSNGVGPDRPRRRRADRRPDADVPSGRAGPRRSAAPGRHRKDVDRPVPSEPGDGRHRAADPARAPETGPRTADLATPAAATPAVMPAVAVPEVAVPEVSVHDVAAAVVAVDDVAAVDDAAVARVPVEAVPPVLGAEQTGGDDYSVEGWGLAELLAGALAAYRGL